MRVSVPGPITSTAAPISAKTGNRAIQRAKGFITGTLEQAPGRRGYANRHNNRRGESNDLILTSSNTRHVAKGKFAEEAS